DRSNRFPEPHRQPEYGPRCGVLLLQSAGRLRQPCCRYRAGDRGATSARSSRSQQGDGSMTRREKALLMSGLLIGALAVTAVLIGRQYLVSRHELTAAASEPTAPMPAPTPDAVSSPDAAPSVQLTEQEQKAIGVETVEVKRQAIQREITAPGKVAEPE